MSEMKLLYLVLGRPLGRFPVGLATAGLVSPVFRGTFWKHGRTNVAGISRFGKVVRVELNLFGEN